MKNKVSLSKYTTLKVGGDAEYFTEVSNESELVSACKIALEKKLPVRILGGGSNILVSDTGVGGLVIHNLIRGIETDTDGDDVFLTVGAGETLDEFIETTVAEGFWGLENLSHIPGSVGATPVQNVGAYGVEVSDFIELVRVYDLSTQTFKTLKNSECHFGYRDSIFKHDSGSSYVVCSVTFKLSKKAYPKLDYKDLNGRFEGVVPSQTEIRNAIIEIRNKKFPDWHTVGTAGSFFKNPLIQKKQFNDLKKNYPDMPGFEQPGDMVKVPLGWILDKVLNLRGIKNGNVGTYEGQALVLINCGHATAVEITNVADEISKKVSEVLGVNIEWEVTKW